MAGAMPRTPTDGYDKVPIPEDILHVGVTTRSGSVLYPRLPDVARLLPLPRGKLVQAQEGDKLCQDLKEELDSSQPTPLYSSKVDILCRRGHTQGEQDAVGPESLRNDTL